MGDSVVFSVVKRSIVNELSKDVDSFKERSINITFGKIRDMNEESRVKVEVTIPENIIAEGLESLGDIYDSYKKKRFIKPGPDDLLYMDEDDVKDHFLNSEEDPDDDDDDDDDEEDEYDTSKDYYHLRYKKDLNR